MGFQTLGPSELSNAWWRTMRKSTASVSSPVTGRSRTTYYKYRSLSASAVWEGGALFNHFAAEPTGNNLNLLADRRGKREANVP